MNRIACVFLLSFLTVLPASGQARRTPSAAPMLQSPPAQDALPWWTDYRFPVFETGKPMSVEQMIALELRPAVLIEPWVCLNRHPERHRFEFETMPEGTIVLVDNSGLVRYKYDCSNRLVEIPGNSWPATIPILPTTNPVIGLPQTTWQRFTGWSGRVLRNFFAHFQ